VVRGSGRSEAVAPESGAWSSGRRAKAKKTTRAARAAGLRGGCEVLASWRPAGRMKRMKAGGFSGAVVGCSRCRSNVWTALIAVGYRIVAPKTSARRAS